MRSKRQKSSDTFRLQLLIDARSRTFSWILPALGTHRARLVGSSDCPEEMVDRAADRPKASPARTRPDVAQPGLTAAPSHGELKLIAQTLCLPLLVTSNSADLVAQIKASSMAKEGGDAGVCTALVHAAFKLIDKNGDGALSRIEIVKALRTSAQVRKLLALPEKIRQEDGTRDLFERVYQAIDTDDSKSITLTEFEAYFSPATQPGPPPAASTLSDGTILVSLTVTALAVAYALLLIRHLALAKLSVGGSPSAATVAAAVNGDTALAVSAVSAVAKTVAARVAAAVANSAVGAAIAARGAAANSAAGAAATATVATAAAPDATADAPADATADTADAPAESSGAAIYRAAGYPPADPAATPSPMSV